VEHHRELSVTGLRRLVPHQAALSARFTRL